VLMVKSIGQTIFILRRREETVNMLNIPLTNSFSNSRPADVCPAAPLPDGAGANPLTARPLFFRASFPTEFGNEESLPVPRIFHGSAQGRIGGGGGGSIHRQVGW